MNHADQSSLTDEQENPSLVLTSPPRVLSEHHCGPVTVLRVRRITGATQESTDYSRKRD